MGPGPALNHRGQGVSPVAVQTLGSRYGIGWAERTHRGFTVSLGSIHARSLAPCSCDNQKCLQT